MHTFKNPPGGRAVLGRVEDLGHLIGVKGPLAGDHGEFFLVGIHAITTTNVLVARCRARIVLDLR